MPTPMFISGFVAQIYHVGMTAGEALKTIKTLRDVWPSNENLAHIARD